MSGTNNEDKGSTNARGIIIKSSDSVVEGDSNGCEGNDGDCDHKLNINFNTTQFAIIVI